MDHTTPAPDHLHDYDVVDADGKKVGSVEHFWLDTATNQLEFIAVKPGGFMAKSRVMPAANAQIDEANRQIRVPYTADQIKGAPHFDNDAEFHEDDERRVYDYYGIGRSTAPSPTGLADDAGTTGERDEVGTAAGVDTDEDHGDARPSNADRDQANVTLAEEQLRVGTRQVEAGRARLRKVVRTEHVSAPVELRREEVTIERVPASGEEVPADAFQEQEIEVPVMREEPVVEKEVRATEQVRVRKAGETEHRAVEGDVRREDVELDREGEADVRATERERR